MQRGITLIELLLTLAILSILLSIGALSFSNIQIKSRLALVSAEVRAELLRAQYQSENGVPSGIYFEANKYVFFEGETYIEGDPDNVETNLPSSIEFSGISLPSNLAQFDSLTGYLINYSDPSYVTIEETRSGQSKTVMINRWGVLEIQ